MSTATSTAPSAHDEQTIRRVVTSALVGATIEWYDFFLYGVVAGIVFNKLYFPTGDPVVATLLAYTTFAVGFVARPLGGIIFGHFGDRIGRKSMLIMTLMIMGVATFLIGLVPTYEQIGVWAPSLLLLLRVLQGIGLGGEWGGAVLMAVRVRAAGEARLLRRVAADRPGDRADARPRASSRCCRGSSPTRSSCAWGWRVAFLISACDGRRRHLHPAERPGDARVRRGQGAGTPSCASRSPT